MERLTEWLGAANDRCAMPNSEVCRIGQRHDWEQMAINKLAEYEDLEEQGLLVRLPCKAGDTVSGIYNDLDLGICIKTYTVTEITYDENGTKIFGSSNGWVTLIREDDFGKNVFLTREDAEAALRKMGGDGE